MLINNLIQRHDRKFVRTFFNFSSFNCIYMYVDIVETNKHCNLTLNLKSSLQVAICSFISRRILNISMLSDYRRMNSLSTKYCRARIPSLPWPPTAPSSMKLAFTFTFTIVNVRLFHTMCESKIMQSPRTMQRFANNAPVGTSLVLSGTAISSSIHHCIFQQLNGSVCVLYGSLPVLGLSD